jgi:hypothetical protein
MGTTRRRIVMSWKVSTQECEHPTGTLFQCPGRLGDTVRLVRPARSRVLVHTGRLRHTTQHQMSPLLHAIQGWSTATVGRPVLDEPAIRASGRRLGPQGPSGELDRREGNRPSAGSNRHGVVARRRDEGARDSAPPGPPHVRGCALTGAVPIGHCDFRRQPEASVAATRGELGLAGAGARTGEPGGMKQRRIRDRPR